MRKPAWVQSPLTPLKHSPWPGAADQRFLTWPCALAHAHEQVQEAAERTERGLREEIRRLTAPKKKHGLIDLDESPDAPPYAEQVNCPLLLPTPYLPPPTPCFLLLPSLTSCLPPPRADCHCPA